MPRRAPPDAIALLKEDHRKVEDLFEKFDKARKEERKQALARATTSVPAATPWAPTAALAAFNRDARASP